MRPRALPPPGRLNHADWADDDSTTVVVVAEGFRRAAKRVDASGGRASGSHRPGDGSVIYDHSAISDEDLVLTTARTEVRERAAKYLSVSLAITDLMIGQGEDLLAEFETILSALESG